MGQWLLKKYIYLWPFDSYYLKKEWFVNVKITEECLLVQHEMNGCEYDSSDDSDLILNLNNLNLNCFKI